MEYKINENECERRNELPRLIRHVINSNAGLARMLVGDYLRKPNPTYSKNHKRTPEDFKREEEFFKNRNHVINKIRTELIGLYHESTGKDVEEITEIHSLILLNICSECNQNPQCSNYQIYLGQNTRNS